MSGWPTSYQTWRINAYNIAKQKVPSRLPAKLSTSVDIAIAVYEMERGDTENSIPDVPVYMQDEDSSHNVHNVMRQRWIRMKHDNV